MLKTRFRHDVDAVRKEMAEVPWLRQCFDKWGERQVIPQSELSEDDFVELRELFDMQLYDTDGEAYHRTTLGDKVWDSLS